MNAKKAHPMTTCFIANFIRGAISCRYLVRYLTLAIIATTPSLSQSAPVRTMTYPITNEGKKNVNKCIVVISDTFPTTLLVNHAIRLHWRWKSWPVVPEDMRVNRWVDRSIATMTPTKAIDRWKYAVPLFTTAALLFASFDMMLCVFRQASLRSLAAWSWSIEVIGPIVRVGGLWCRCWGWLSPGGFVISGVHGLSVSMVVVRWWLIFVMVKRVLFGWFVGIADERRVVLNTRNHL